MRVRLHPLTTIKERLKQCRVVVLMASRASLLSSVIHAAFYSHNDFACCSNNKWLYVFIPVRWTPCNTCIGNVMFYYCYIFYYCQFQDVLVRKNELVKKGSNFNTYQERKFQFWVLLLFRIIIIASQSQKLQIVLYVMCTVIYCQVLKPALITK